MKRCFICGQKIGPNEDWSNAKGPSGQQVAIHTRHPGARRHLGLPEAPREVDPGDTQGDSRGSGTTRAQRRGQKRAQKVRVPGRVRCDKDPLTEDPD